MSFLQPRPEETGPTSATVFTYDTIVWGACQCLGLNPQSKQLGFGNEPVSNSTCLAHTFKRD